MVRRCTCGCVGSGGLFHGPDTDTVLNFPANRLEAYRKWVVDTLKRLVEDELAIAMAQMIFSTKIVVHFATYHYPPLRGDQLIAIGGLGLMIGPREGENLSSKYFLVDWFRGVTATVRYMACTYDTQFIIRFIE